MSGGVLDQLKKSGFRFQKRYGQNFITDTNLLNAIAADAGISKEDHVIEVGAGAGTLTRALCEQAGFVTAFEIDKNLTAVLNPLVQERDNLMLVYDDILKSDVSLFTHGKPFKVVANLPYYITTPVLFYFLGDPLLQSMTIMVQKEVAERLVAKANTPEYGAVTAQLRTYGDAKITRFVSRALFTPQPNVDSAAVHIVMEPKAVFDYMILQKLIASAFAMRRKTLLNNLTRAFNFPRDKAAFFLKQVNLPEDVRGEVLSIDDFIKLANLMAEYGK